MGRVDDRHAVAGPDARVIGVEGLRVADSSVSSTITAGNLNAPTIMLAEKAADHIGGATPLPPSDLPFYRAEGGETAQR